jgi:hypothetical protein
MNTALICAASQVDPHAWGGWDGKSGMVGAEIDASRQMEMLSSNGSKPALLWNKQFDASPYTEGCLRGIRDAQRGMDDIFILALLCHCGQKPDQNGDEADKLDEYLCGWSGPILDDINARIYRALRPGQRMAILADCCHAEGFIRGRMPAGIGAGVDPRQPFDRVLRRATSWRSDTGGQVMYFAACREHEYADGPDNGGRATTAWYRTWKGGDIHAPWWRFWNRDRQTLTWVLWSDMARKRVNTQTMVRVEYGPVTAAFRAARVMQ